MSPNRKRNEYGVRYGALLKSLLLCAMIGGAGIGYVWQKQQVYELGKKKAQAELRRDHYRQQNERLVRNLAWLQSPAYLEEQVKKLNLGLVPPTPDQVWHMSDTKSSTLKTTPLAMGSNTGGARAVAR